MTTSSELILNGINFRRKFSGAKTHYQFIALVAYLLLSLRGYWDLMNGATSGDEAVLEFTFTFGLPLPLAYVQS